MLSCFFFFNDTATTEIYTLSLHDALPISLRRFCFAGGLLRGAGRRVLDRVRPDNRRGRTIPSLKRSEEHTSELQSRLHLVCRLLLEKKKKKLSALMTTWLPLQSDMREQTHRSA